MDTIAVTGATGYVGGRVLARAVARGLSTLVVGRRPAPGTDFRFFDLADPVHVDLSGVRAIIHAAHDFSAVGPEIVERNLRGGEALLASAARANARPVFVSSLSAFKGCRSQYGRMKLQLESCWSEQGGTSIRAGIVFGKDAGGIFGALRRAIEKVPLVPLLAPPWTPFYVTHDWALADALINCALNSTSRHNGTVLLAANPEPVSFGELVQQIADGLGRDVRLVRMPRDLALWALTFAEYLGMSAPFRSDSLRSLAKSIPADQLARLPPADSSFPPLVKELWVESFP
jgi:nucleoside-diphosphate-sugar epimerase